MKVLLAKPVEKLGETGEVVEVARGYARNYLFPQRLAVDPTPHNVKRLEKHKRAREAELRDREQSAKVLQKQLEGSSFTFQRTAQEEGKLYGSVRLEDIVAAIEEKTGQALERDRVKLEAPIENVGSYNVTINVYKDLHAQINVVVEAEGEAKADAGDQVAAVEDRGETDVEGDNTPA